MIGRTSAIEESRMMRLMTILTTLTVLAVAAGLSGCEMMQYNGSIAWPGTADDDIQAYQQYLKDRDLAEEAVAGTQTAGMTDLTAGDPMRPDRVSMTGQMAGMSAPKPQYQPQQQPLPQPTFGDTQRQRTAISAYGQFASHTPQGPAQDTMGNVQRVSFTTEGADFDPEIDPTGKWLVFASTRHNTTADIYYKRIDATAVTQLTNDPSNDVMPAVSPDGKKIAFTSDRSGNWDIYMMDAAGGQPVQLTNDPAHEIHPTFAPDGTQVAYCRFGEQSGRWELVIVDLSNPSTKRFIGYGLFPSWSPSGKHIVFQRARERGTRWFSIWTIELVNGEAMRPTEIAASGNAAAITPAWSPDGKQLVFSTVVDGAAGGSAADRPQQADIWMVDLDGRNRINLTHSRYTNLQPTWAADGTIYFASNRAGHDTENIWALSPDRAQMLAQSTRDTPTRSAEAPKQQWPTGLGSPAAPSEAAVYVDPAGVNKP